jgi:hypothetical protein
VGRWFSKDDDLPITASTGVSWLKAALKAAKLRVHGPHTLRHTTEAAIALLEAPPPRRRGAGHDIGSASGEALETARDHSPSMA